ncbi:M28 family metallopeptidase [Sphingomonas morindae]|uniref:M28 family peptidase n=1 Tax=Sphingomonas morindae TaxID=1541170 RepID=A0ABY4XDS1_9SPHN|nr:M28 family peptidase [Sphingomonas morindae]USI74999.1 M28 family peptidase [Sphingomonas morindae]
MRKTGIGLALLAGAAMASAAPKPGWIVNPAWVHAEESFLASDALRGRGSFTRDEAIAAAYVGSQFEAFGLKPAPGLTGYVQTAPLIHTRVEGAPRLSLAGRALPAPTLVVGPLGPIEGKVALVASGDPADLPEDAPIVAVAAPRVEPAALFRAARAKHIGLVVIEASAASAAWRASLDPAPAMPSYVAGDPPARRTAFATLDAAGFAALRAGAGAIARLDVTVARDPGSTSNAIGYLPGTDPQAGVILLSAHLDHLGQRADGTIFHGANDDASGTTAVMELARALAATGPHRRGLLFVAYGSEEAGTYGSRYFGAHPPVPLTSLVANIEFEMIGAQDPRLPAGALMMTGFPRSDLGAALKAGGALIAPDPYPEEHFFERSDNYALALKGVVAHTLSGWAVVPTYHQPTDDLAHIDFPFMTRAIQSLVGPVQTLANGRFTPHWQGEGQPKE